MEFTVLWNDDKETEYYLAPNETLLFSQHGQLLVANHDDHSLVAVPREGKYVIIFENPNELPLGASIRLIY